MLLFKWENSKELRFVTHGDSPQFSIMSTKWRKPVTAERTQPLSHTLKPNLPQSQSARVAQAQQLMTTQQLLAMAGGAAAGADGGAQALTEKLGGLAGVPLNSLLGGGLYGGGANFFPNAGLSAGGQGMPMPSPALLGLHGLQGLIEAGGMPGAGAGGDSRKRGAPFDAEVDALVQNKRPFQELPPGGGGAQPAPNMHGYQQRVSSMQMSQSEVQAQIQTLQIQMQQQEQLKQLQRMQLLLAGSGSQGKSGPGPAAAAPPANPAFPRAAPLASDSGLDGAVVLEDMRKRQGACSCGVCACRCARVPACTVAPPSCTGACTAVSFHPLRVLPLLLCVRLLLQQPPLQQLPRRWRHGLLLLLPL